MSRKLVIGIDGREIPISHARLYPADEVNQWREMISDSELDPQSPLLGLGLSLIGGPAFLVGRAVFNRVLNVTLSAAAKAHALEKLKQANALMDTIRAHGTLFPIQDVMGIDVPIPKAWVAIHRIEAPATRAEAGVNTAINRLLRRGVATKADEATLCRVIDKAHIALDDDFVTLNNHQGDIRLRWTAVNSYRFEE